MTSTWILIVMVIFNGVAITNVPGFPTEAACQVAASKTQETVKPWMMRSVSTVCVETGKGDR